MAILELPKAADESMKAKTGTPEHWNTETLEHWNTGTLERLFLSLHS